MSKQRQEVLNIVLAQLLQERGVISAPEQIFTLGLKRHMPDVIVNYNGLRLAIECEIGTTSQAEAKALDAVDERVINAIVHLGLAVVYPAPLKETDFDQLKIILSTSELRIAIASEFGRSEYKTGRVDDIEQLLRRTFEELLEENLVAEITQLLDAKIELFAMEIINQNSSIERLAQILGIRDLSSKGKE